VPPSDAQGTTLYQIRVAGRLDATWSDWFNGMQLAVETSADGIAETILTGEVDDQAALHGLLMRVRDLGLPLLEVQRVKQCKAAKGGGANPN